MGTVHIIICKPPTGGRGGGGNVYKFIADELDGWEVSGGILMWNDHSNVLIMGENVS